MPSRIVTLVVNGQPRELIATPGLTLLEALRGPLGLTAAKRGCAQGTCGTCTVLLDGEPVVSCLVPVETIDGEDVATLEGVADGKDLDEVQEAFLDNFATQCGFCTSGMIMSAEALLDRNPEPTRDDVVEAISGNVCRCTGYASIIDAVVDAAARRSGDGRTDHGRPDHGRPDHGRPGDDAGSDPEAGHPVHAEQGSI